MGVIAEWWRKGKKKKKKKKKKRERITANRGYSEKL
jgi:hypothetical protein